MRIAPSQVNRQVRLTTPGSLTISRDVLLQAGLTKYDVMCIGAAGGRAGDAVGTSNKLIMKGAGGGGGGSIHLKGNLIDLPALINISLGAPGTTGANSGNNVTAGAGTPGGNAVFDTIIAYGGGGATGGKANVVGSMGAGTSSVAGVGGLGGTNSLALGSGGAGGHSADYEGGQSYVTPTAGTFVANAMGPTFGGGRGGGGGGGAGWIGGFNPIWSGMGDATDGASGSSNGTSGTTGLGQPKQSPYGGLGGGANAYPILGVDVAYGGGLSPNGAVLANFS